MPHTRQAAQARLDWGGELRVPPTPHARARSQPDRPVLQGDIILLGLRDFQARCPSPRPARPPPPLRGRIPERPPRTQDQKADIIQKYDGDEARSLKTYGELPDTGARPRPIAATDSAVPSRSAARAAQCKSMRAPRCSTARTLAATTSISTRTAATRTEPSRATLRAAHPRPVPRDAAGPGRARRLATAHRPAPICSQGMVRRRHSTRGCL